MRTTITLSKAWEGFTVEKRAEGSSPNTLRNYGYTWKKIQRFLDEKHEGADPVFKKLKREFWVEFMAWLQDEYTFSALRGVTATTGEPEKSKIQTQNLSAKSCCNVHTDLSSFYTWAVKSELVKKHLLRSINAPDHNEPLIEPFTKAEAEQLLHACDHYMQKETKCSRVTTLRDKAIITLFLSTGIRVSELCAIKFSDVDMNTRCVIVSGKGPGRDPKRRAVYFGRRTHRYLWRYILSLENKRPQDPLFQSAYEPGEPLSRNALVCLFKRLGQRAGLTKKAHPHRFRHTFAINYLRNGGDLLTLQSLLGHTSLQMVKRYTRIAQQDCEAAQERADPVDNWRL